MSKRALAGLAAVTLLSVTACGSQEAGKAEPKSSTATKSPSTAAGSNSDDAKLGGIIADNPKDVTWLYPTDVTSSWKRLQTEQGSAQWQVNQHCVLTLQQPSGLGSDREPTQEQVLEKYAKNLESGIGTQLKLTDRDKQSFPVKTNTDSQMSTRLSRAHMTGSTPGIEGEIYAYRSGDFALVLMTVCGKDHFAKTNATKFAPFIKKLAVSAKY